MAEDWTREEVEIIVAEYFDNTAWWYSNGKVETISQLDWRMRMLKGEPGFCLVNVTAGDEGTLIDGIDSMLGPRVRLGVVDRKIREKE